MREGAGYSSDYICQIVVWSQYLELDTNENLTIFVKSWCGVNTWSSIQMRTKQLRIAGAALWWWWPQVVE